MKNDLLELISNSNPVTSLLEKKGTFVLNDTIGVSLLFASAWHKKKDKYLIVCSNLYNAQRVNDLLSSLIGDENVFLYPTDDLLRSEMLTASKELLSQRLYVLNEALNNKNKIIVAHTSSLITPLPSTNEFIRSKIKFKVGEIIDLDLVKQILVKSGYSRVSKIDQSLEFAIRGDILDIFSVNYLKPIRIELFGDEIESIRYFDIATQSSNDALEEVEILPANDCLFTDLELDEFKLNATKQVNKDKDIIGYELGEQLQANVGLDIERICERTYHPRVYKYYRYIKKETWSIVDYFNPSLTFIANDKQFDVTYNFLIKEAFEYFIESFERGKLMSHLEMYQDVNDALKYSKKTLRGRPLKEKFDDLCFETRPLIFSKANSANIEIILQQYLNENSKLVFAVSNKQQYDTVKAYLESNNLIFENLKNLAIPEKKLGIALFSLEEGFELIDPKVIFVSSKELFGFQNNSTRFHSRFKEATILKNYDELVPGDYVVHEYYGIGKFLEIKTMIVDGINRDFIHIQYGGTSTLYVPLNQFRLVRKYCGREGAEPKLSNLSSKEWEKTKAKIKERVNLLADRLYQLYSERAQIKGFQFSKDDELQESFESEFPYELTADQKTAIEDIKKDMESPIVMDRLLCGDVGFGKTEVAFRAIFKAISSGKQAAILCPTTLLARQHYELAVERFRNYGVKIAVISRLVPEKTQKLIMREIKDGIIHLVIGTHRLLSKDFSFKDLGLLVVDEEQRFGVEQKEKIKELKTNLDVLSLSATPIPRTLQLSLIGVRPVSQITTAPNNRSTIQTYVAPFSDEVCKELMERELSRHGQVFYVHNVVYSIGTTAAHIQRQIPQARIGIVHGQMDKDEIEDVMMRFYSGEIDILVATSIIENGIDVPNANLIIVEDADKFGLSQLYQIKGRVGRGGTLAYAYLFYKEQKELNQNAQKRLKAIQDFAELGSGYKIAQRDLMIRGAGDILGPEQAGFIDSVGLDLYLKMLNEVIEEKKTGKPIEAPKPVKLFKLDAYIPDGYVEKEDKIQIYQEIEGAKSEKELNSIKKHIRDVYGKIPDSLNLLLKKRKVDIFIEGPEFTDVNEIGESIELVLSKKFAQINGIGGSLFECLGPYLNKLSLNYLNKTLKVRLKKEGNWILDLETIVEVVHNLYIKYSKDNNIEV